MKGKLALLYALFAAILLFGSISQSFASLSYASGWSTSVTLSTGNPSTEYIPRGMDVDNRPGASAGTIYVAMDGKAAASSYIVKLSANGTGITKWGSTLSYNGSTINLDQSLVGVAVDPVSGQLYVAVNTNGNTVGMVYIIDTSTGTVVGQLSTGLTRIGGCAFSRDGSKFAVCGFNGDQKLGHIGVRLFTRTANGFTFTADLMSQGRFLTGLGDYAGFIKISSSTLRDMAFDAQDNVYVLGALGIIKFSTTAPYQVTAEMGTNAARWGIDVDNSGYIYTGSGTADGSTYPVIMYTPGGIRLDTATPTGTKNAVPENVALDRVNGRLIVVGRDSGKTSCYVDSLVWTPPTSTQLVTSGYSRLHGYVKNQSGQGIAGARVAAVWWSLTSTWTTKIIGSSHAIVTGSDGSYEVYLPSEMVGNCMLEFDAPGYLRQRHYGVSVGADTTYNITLTSASANSITWLAPAPGSDPYGSDKKGNLSNSTTAVFFENGLHNYITRYGGCAIPVSISGTNTMQIGSRTDAGSSGSLDNYLYVDVDDEWLYNGSPTSTVWVTIEYLDDTRSMLGYDNLALEADCGSYGVGWFAEIQKIPPMSETFKRKTFKLTHASFGGRFTDTSTDAVPMFSDLRVSAHMDPYYGAYFDDQGPDWIKSLTVSKVAPAPDPNEKPTIKAAKTSGGDVILQNKVITSDWGGNKLYVEEPERVTGLKIDISPAIVQGLDQAIGLPISVSGKILTEASGEPVLMADSFQIDPGAASTSIGALLATCKTINSLTVIDMTGLKVRVAGRVTSAPVVDVANGGGSYTINDGSGEVKVIVDSILETDWPSLSDYVVVEGIASMDSGARCIKPWSTSYGPGNGTFELADWAGWTLSGTGNDMVASLITDDFHGGSQCASFTRHTAYSSGAGAMVSRWDNCVVPGVPYKVTAWVKSTNANACSLEFWDRASAYCTVDIPANTNGWTKVSGVFTGLAWGVESRINVNGSTGSLKVDDISIQPVLGGFWNTLSNPM